MGNAESAPVAEVVVETVPAEEAAPVPVPVETKEAPQANPEPESVPEASGIVDLEADCEGRKSMCSCVIS